MDIEQIKSELQTLRQQAEKAVCSLRERKETIPDAVNWARISCFGAEKIIDDEGSEYFRILIDECSPDALIFKGELLKEVVKILSEEQSGLYNRHIEVLMSW